jgi:hypothetical protein
MSKKMLKFAGQRRTLLVLIMATVTLGFVLSGWLTPTRSRADNDDDDPQPTVEKVKTACAGEGSVDLFDGTDVPVGCIGSPISVDVDDIEVFPADVKTTTTYSDGSQTATHDYTDPDYVVTWTATVGSFTTTGTGLPAVFTPTNTGTGTVSYSCHYTNNTPCCDKGTSTATSSFKVDAVTSLTSSAGEWVDDGDNDANTATYLVQVGCNDTITITAADSLGLDASALPSCWTWTVNPSGNATKTDNKTYSVDGNTVGKTTLNVTCGTSSKTITLIVYKAIFTLYADQAVCDGHNEHAWWSLTLQPSEATDLIDNNGCLGVAGYAPVYSIPNPLALHGPGIVNFGPQGHSPTADYWWCISFTNLQSALNYVEDATGMSVYDVTDNNCAEVAVGVAKKAGESLDGYTGWTPCDLSHYLIILEFVTPPFCACQQ